MKCHCNEIEELRVENDTLRELLRGATEDRARLEDEVERLRERVKQMQYDLILGPAATTGEAKGDLCDGCRSWTCVHNGCRNRPAPVSSDEDEFFQCPHETGMATCPDPCGCSCEGCQR